MSSKVTLNTVNYYNASDIYEYNSDNRPLYNISSNVDLLNSVIASAGFYQEISADPETEPVGGFLPLTCAYVGYNGLLHPIDISQAITVIDYATVPIYLITAALGNSNYKALSFSSTITISNLYNSFLSTSTGNALKVGPGGALVDEVYFDLYYSGYNYQNLFVGKILTSNTISFGGNQVSVLSDNRFIAKNINDSTTGLLTKYIDNSVTSVSDFGVLVNTTNSAYPFIAYVNQVGYASSVASLTASSFSSTVPVYFSSSQLTTNQDGTFAVANVESLLDELHFASPALAADLLSNDKLGTAGVNIRTLYGFTQNYMLHSQNLSTNLSELSQNISTSLYFNSSAATSTIGLFAQFDAISTSYGQTATSITGATLSPFLTTTAMSYSHGISFGTFKSNGLGAFIGYITNTDTTLNYLDASTSNVVSTLVGSSTLSISNKNSANNAIISFDTDMIVLNTSIGAYYKNTASNALEITNKAYVDSAVNALTSSIANMIPLAGNSSSNPITGSLYTDVTSNSDSSTVMLFNTMSVTNIASANPVQFSALTSSGIGGLQTVRGLTTQDSTFSNTTDLTTVSWVKWYVSTNTIVGPAILANNQTFTGTNTFNNTVSFTNDNPIIITSPDSPVSQASIVCNSASLLFNANSTSTFRLYMDPAITLTSSDAANCILNKGYLDNNLDTLVENILGPSICASWSRANVNLNGSQSYSNTTFGASQSPTNWVSAVNPTSDYDNGFITSTTSYFTYNNDGSYTFNGLNSGTEGAVFHIDLNLSNPTSYKTFILQSVILKVDSSNTIYVLDSRYESATASGSWFTLGTSFSTTVFLNPLDKIYLLVGTTSCSGVNSTASIVRIR
jgi:hypothetical protein